MTKQVAEDTLNFIKSAPLTFSTVKFFGGEPLLKKDIIQQVVGDFPYSSDFHITTNLTLIEEEFFKFCQTYGVQLTYSIDGDAAVNNLQRVSLYEGPTGDSIVKNAGLFNSKDIIINQCITPLNVKDFFKNFLFIYKLGYRKFTFLPVYFLMWNPEALSHLILGFREISRFTKDNELIFNDPSAHSEVTYNIAFVIDYNGDIFLSDIYLISSLKKYRDQLKVGSIYSTFDFGILSDSSFIEQYQMKIHQFIEQEFTHQVRTSLKYLAKISNHFLQEAATKT